MALEIRIPESSWSLQEVLLEDTLILLELSWNSRNESWHVSLFDVDEDPIILGVKVTEAVSITKRYTDNRLPSGNIYCVKMNPRASKIDRKNLGLDFKLIYLTSEEEEDVGI